MQHYPGQKTIFFTAIKAKLCKDAAQVVRHQNPNNWSDLKKFLLEYYTNKKSLNKRIVYLSLLKQGISMSVRDFVNKIQLQYEGIKQIIEFEHRNIGDGFYLIDDIVLKTFLDGLIYEISIVVRAQQPRDFNQALEIAMKTEMDLGFPRTISKYCDHCKTSTHFTKYCRILANQSVQLFKNNLSFNNHRRENNYNSNRGSNNRFGTNQNYRGSYNFNINRNNNFGRNGGFKNQNNFNNNNQNNFNRNNFQNRGNFSNRNWNNRNNNGQTNRNGNGNNNNSTRSNANNYNRTNNDNNNYSNNNKSNNNNSYRFPNNSDRVNVIDINENNLNTKRTPSTARNQSQEFSMAEQ